MFEDKGTCEFSMVEPMMTETSRTLPVRDEVPSKPATRDLILDAAARVFLQHGYESTSMDRVAEEAAVGRRTVYNQFKSKSALFDATVARIWLGMPIKQILSEAEAVRDPEVGLRRIGLAIAEFWAPPAAVAFVQMIIRERDSFPDLAKSFFKSGKEAALKAVITYLETMNDQGSLLVSDADIAARQFVGMINEPLLWFRVVGFGRNPSAARRQRVVEEAVKTFLCRYQKTA